MINVEGNTAIITGGTKGIGLGIAAALLRLDMRVAITGRSDLSVNKGLKSLGQNHNVIGIVSDVRNPADEVRAVERVLQKWGRLDVLIANAGIGHFASIQEMSSDQWTDTIDINLTGVFNSVKACVPALINSKGYIITIASLAGTNFFAKGAAYNASKFGLVGFSQAIMLDLRSDDVKVTTIMPGSVSTYFNGHTPSDDDVWKIQPEDIGKLVADLLQMHPRTLPSKIEVRPSKTKL